MKQFALLDLCYPDYFTGYSKPVLSVPLFSHCITNGEMADMINEELNVCYDMFTEGYSKTEILIIEEFINDLRKDPNIIYYETEPGSYEMDEEMNVCIYFYFGIVKPVFTHGGLTFLNS